MIEKYISNAGSFIIAEFYNILSIASFILSVFAIWLAYYFWKNPIESKTLRYVEDEENEIHYAVGKKGKKWFVEKKFLKNVSNGAAFKFIADIENNAKLKNAPNNLIELRKLNYREIE